MNDDPLHQMIRDALHQGRRNEPIPCDGCGTPTPPDQIREASVPDHRVDFGGYDVTLRRVGRYCRACSGRMQPPYPARSEARHREEVRDHG